LIGDHSTMEVMQEEIEAHLSGRQDRLSVPARFRDHVAQARLGLSAAEHESFFGAMLGDIDEPCAPFGLMDVQGDGGDASEAHELLEPELAQRLRSAARRLGVSVAALFHLAFGQVVSRASGRSDAVFGTVLFGRWGCSSTRCRCGCGLMTAAWLRRCAGPRNSWPGCCGMSTPRWRWRS